MERLQKDTARLVDKFDRDQAVLIDKTCSYNIFCRYPVLDTVMGGAEPKDNVVNPDGIWKEHAWSTLEPPILIQIPIHDRPKDPLKQFNNLVSVFCRMTEDVILDKYYRFRQRREVRVFIKYAKRCFEI